MKMNFDEKSPKYIAAKLSLPQELQPLFTQLVDEYSFFAMKNYGRGWVAYAILADLIKAGWRPSVKADR